MEIQMLKDRHDIDHVAQGLLSLMSLAPNVDEPTIFRQRIPCAFPYQFRRVRLLAA